MTLVLKAKLNIACTIIVLILIVGLLLQNILTAAEINLWSVAFTQQAFNDQSTSDVVGFPPTNHLGGFIWLAQDALEMGHPSRALELIDIAPSERNLESLRIRGLALERQGRYSEAIEIWVETRDITLLHDAADRAVSEGRPSDAVTLSRAAYTINPIHETLNLANSLWNTAKEYDEAIKILRLSIAASPGSQLRDRWMVQLGKFLRFRGEWDEATSIYHRVIDEDPDNATAWIGLGWVIYDRNADVSAARTVFETAIAIAPETGDGYMAMGQLLAREGLHTEADSWFERAIAKRSNNPWWFLNRANNARDGHDIDHAFQLYEEVISLFPGFAPSYYELAFAYQLNEQRAQAVSAIEQGLARFESPDVDTLLRAGKIYEWDGDASRALEVYRQALLIDPLNATASHSIERLEE